MIQYRKGTMWKDVVKSNLKGIFLFIMITQKTDTREECFR